MSENDTSSSQNVAYIFAGLGAFGLAITLYYLCRRLVVPDAVETHPDRVTPSSSIVIVVDTPHRNPLHTPKRGLVVDTEDRFVAEPQKSRI